MLLMSHEEKLSLSVRHGNRKIGREFRTMRATRLSVANYNTTLSSDSLESGTGKSEFTPLSVHRVLHFLENRPKS